MKPTEKQLANLKDIREYNSSASLEKRRASASKGGKASARAKKERKTMAENMMMLLSLNLKDGKQEALKNLSEAKTANMDVQTAIGVAIVSKALKGDVQAYNAIRDIIGEKPIEKIQQEASQDIVVIHPVGSKRKKK